MTVKNTKRNFGAIAAIACCLTGITSVVSISQIQSVGAAPVYTVADAGHSEPSSHQGSEIEAEEGHGGAAHSGESHHHEAIAVTDETSVPQVRVVAEPDAKSGWNVHVQTENFTFAPERVNQDNRPNEGHAHLYVDGQKVARLYGPWYHLDGLEAGTYEITVSLHANGHETWTYEGEAIAHTITITVPATIEPR